MNQTELDKALRALCERLDYHQNVDILIVGGAAGLITGLLPCERTTGDCDVMDYAPATALAAVELAADEVGRQLQLPEHWFNSNVQIRLDSLPDGWQQRKILVDRGDRLAIYAASPIDLIAMKFLAHRPQDLHDLVALKVTEADRLFVRSFLAEIRRRGSNAQEIFEAEEVLSSWPVHEHR